MAYDLAERFPPLKSASIGPDKYELGSEFQQGYASKVPFLCSAPRTTGIRNPKYTDALYYPNVQQRVVGGASLRFTSERLKFAKHDSSEFDEPIEVKECHCLDENYVAPVCQGKVKRKLYQCKVPFNNYRKLCSIPSKNSKGYKEEPDGRLTMIPPEDHDTTGGPAKYLPKHGSHCTRYKGSFWSHQTGSRGLLFKSDTPGPGAYCLAKRQPTQMEVCLNEVQQENIRNALPNRYLDVIVRKMAKEKLPSPSDYYPEPLRCNRDPSVKPVPMISGAPRFPGPSVALPGPADYSPKITERCASNCLMTPFGVFAKRFNRKFNDSPGPGAYDVFSGKVCSEIRCRPPGTAFLVSSERFTQIEKEPGSYEESVCEEEKREGCVLPTSGFRDQSKRFPSWEKDYLSSPADLDIMPAFHGIKDRCKPKRCDALGQARSPFDTSQARFRCWGDWFDRPRDTYPNCSPADVNLHIDISEGKGQTFTKSVRAGWPNHNVPGPGSYECRSSFDKSFKTYNARLRVNAIEECIRLNYNPLHVRRAIDKRIENIKPKIKTSTEVLALIDAKDSDVIKIAEEKETDEMVLLKRHKSVSPGPGKMQARCRDGAPRLRHRRTPDDQLLECPELTFACCPDGSLAARRRPKDRVTLKDFLITKPNTSYF